MEKNNKKIIICILCLLMIIIGLGVYFIFIKNDDKDVYNGGENSHQEVTNDNNLKEFEEIINNKVKKMKILDAYIDDLKKEAAKISADVSYEIIDNDSLPKTIGAFSDEYEVKISTNGNVAIKKSEEKEEKLLNISGVKDIYNLPLSNIIYILLNNGDVYAYMVDHYDEHKYTAVKINAIKNATNFVSVAVGYDEAGSDFYLGVIDNNNDFIFIDDTAI